MQEKVKCPSCGTEFEFNMEKAVEDKVDKNLISNFPSKEISLKSKLPLSYKKLKPSEKN